MSYTAALIRREAQQTGEHRNPMSGGRCCETEGGFLAAEHSDPVTEFVSVLASGSRIR